MMSPDTHQPDLSQNGAGRAPAVCVLAVETLKKRADFLSLSSAKRTHKKAFVLQARNRDEPDGRIRIGFTCSKKVGNAVERNRAKRRLRAAANAELPASGIPGWDYVLIGRKGITASMPFDHLTRDLRHALREIHP